MVVGRRELVRTSKTASFLQDATQGPLSHARESQAVLFSLPPWRFVLREKIENVRRTMIAASCPMTFQGELPYGPVTASM